MATALDFEAVAGALKQCRPHMENDDEIAYFMWNGCCHSVASALSGANPRFNLRTFLIACGVET